MLASDKLIDAFNQQIGNEMGASMQYIAIASYFDAETLPELAKFFYRQSEEFAARLRAPTLIGKGLNHFTMVETMADPASPLGRAALNMLA